jgi:arylsulfatase A-like enzyme
MFTSDNGPWLPFGADGGSAGLLRGGKGSNWEGGQREPCIVSWPGQVPAGTVCRAVTTAMDLLPTIAALAGAALPDERAIDGHDISALLRGEVGAASPTPHFLYYTAKGELAGIRRGAWKLLFDGPELFQLEEDVSEARNAADKRPELVAELRALAERLDAEITADARPVRTVDAIHFDPERPKDGDPR